MRGEYGPGPEMQAALEALIGPLRDQLTERGMSHAQLAIRLRCDRSRVSRMLAGRQVPTRPLVEAAAQTLGLDTAMTRSQWQAADDIRQQARAKQIAGHPPEGIEDYPGLVVALDTLIRRRGLSHRALVQRDPDRRLRRSTVGAVLRGQRSASHEVIIAIVRACGVTDPTYVAAWDAAWYRVGLPHRQDQHQQQVDGIRQRNYSQVMRRFGYRPRRLA